MTLACAHGRPWPVDPTCSGPDHCRGCHKAVEAACLEFARDVFFGRYNWRGYTEREWVAAGYRRDEWRAA